MLLFNKQHIFQRRVSSAFILWLAKFYLEVNQKQEDNLNYFFHSDSFLLAMALGGDRSNFLKILMKDILLLESNIFEIVGQW